MPSVSDYGRYLKAPAHLSNSKLSLSMSTREQSETFVLTVSPTLPMLCRAPQLQRCTQRQQKHMHAWGGERRRAQDYVSAGAL